MVYFGFGCDSRGHTLSQLRVDLPLLAGDQARDHLSPIPGKGVLAEDLAYSALADAGSLRESTRSPGNRRQYDSRTAQFIKGFDRDPSECRHLSGLAPR